MNKGSTQDDVRDGAKRSRRELLSGVAAGAAGAIGAVALTRPTTTHADNGNAVILGFLNSETDVTIISNTSGVTAFYALTNGSNPGVFGSSFSGEGVYGQSGNVVGTASSSGVHGVTNIASSAAVWGENLGAVAHGAGLGGNGVYGSTDSTGASGVYGHNAGTGYGVAGRAENGTGMLGDSANGTGVVANSASGTALSVSGKAKFNRSGVVSIAHPALSATVTVPGGLSSTSVVLAVMQNAVAGVWVVSAVPNTSTGKATISLNKTPASGSAKVAWFVVN
jgi:hypothetical protein